MPRHAASELQSILPRELVARIKWDKLRTKSDKFVDAKLTSRYSDVLFEVELDGQDAFIYVLFEHKSEPEKWTLLQLLEYMVRIWRAYLRESAPKTVDRLPIILPVVLHHGERGWTAPRRFAEYFSEQPGVSEAVRPYLVDFGFLLDDIGRVGPDILAARPLTAEAKLVLFCLQLGRTPQKFFAELPKRSGELREVWNGPERTVFMSTIMLYMERVGHVPQAETRMALQQVLKLNPAEEIIFAEKVLQERALRKGRREGKIEGKIEGRIEGKREGKIEGKREGTQEFLLKQLKQRFGELPTHAMTRLQTATLAELDEMVLRVLNASTLDEVLRTPKRKRK